VSGWLFNMKSVTMHGNINVKKYSIWISPSAGTGSSGPSSVISGLFITKEAERAGDKVSGGFKMVDVHTLLQACDLPDTLMLF